MWFSVDRVCKEIEWLKGEGVNEYGDMKFCANIPPNGGEERFITCGQFGCQTWSLNFALRVTHTRYLEIYAFRLLLVCDMSWPNSIISAPRGEYFNLEKFNKDVSMKQNLFSGIC